MRIGACLVGLRRAAESTWGLKNANRRAYDPLLMERYQSEALIQTLTTANAGEHPCIYLW